MKKLPKLCNDRNRAYACYQGKRYYFGVSGSREAAQQYAAFITKLAAASDDTPFSFPSAEKADAAPDSITLDELLAGYLDTVEKGKPLYYKVKSLATMILSKFSGFPAAGFTPRCLKMAQGVFEKHWSRHYCNLQVVTLRSVFRWGVENELVPAPVWQALAAIKALRYGKTTAYETEPRQDVPDEVVNRTLPHLSPTIAAMVKLQRVTGSRTVEIVRMKVGDIDTSRTDVWIYTVKEHKNAWRGHERTIPLAKDAQEILIPFMKGKKPTSAVFAPTEAVKEQKIMKRKNRQTPMTPSQRLRDEERSKNPLRSDGEHYTSQTYGRAVKRSIKAANKTLPKDKQIPLWTTYQLRHAKASEVASTAGLDAARAVLGQRTINVTMRYNHADAQKAIEYALQYAARQNLTAHVAPCEAQSD